MSCPFLHFQKLHKPRVTLSQIVQAARGDYLPVWNLKVKQRVDCLENNEGYILFQIISCIILLPESVLGKKKKIIKYLTSVALTGWKWKGSDSIGHLTIWFICAFSLEN